MKEERNNRVFHIAGNYIESQVFHINGGTNYINTLDDVKEQEDGSNSQSGKEETDNDTEIDKELKDELMPVFYNNEENVMKFLGLIKGMKPGDITDLVNKWVEEKLISDYGYSRKGTLWGILSKANLYSKSLQNWNRRVH